MMSLSFKVPWKKKYYRKNGLCFEFPLKIDNKLKTKLSVKRVEFLFSSLNFKFVLNNNLLAPANYDKERELLSEYFV